ncbi:hypothetical protein [Bradyrhizobium sp. CB3481]|uniref:competence protein CoiA family protein n=1 Tax=Bradyrhizobium sp. CB3481 TaxID=3039158 RepID=UPI0024B21EB6|nr:hypothetical protein [Bradyrhizobium sp. CB3481]WFU16457.1 hypothetical protein QA643_36885 [Bradyrhizobium sp. CB3481]
MYWAKERRGGKIIPATRAKHWGDYVCPTCKAAVSLRSGRYRAEHFAHMPGQGKPDCEEFHYSGDLSYDWSQTTAVPQPKVVDPLLLCIELEPEKDSKAARNWRLRLNVPRAPDAHGQIAIDLGSNDTRKISLTKLALGSETYTVNPATSEFGASWVSHEVCQEYREAVTHRISGLSVDFINVFGAAHAKLKSRTYALFWGSSYYLVWRADRQIVLPAGLSARYLARSQNWDCVLVALPHAGDQEIEAWFSEHCDLSIGRSTRDWALVYPPLFSLGVDGEVHVPPSEHIVLALRSTDPSQPGELTFTTGRSNATVELRNGGRDHYLVVRGRDSATENAIHVSWDETFVGTLAPKTYSDVDEICVVAASEGPRGKKRAALHTTSGRELLFEIREGSAFLTEMHAHSSLSGVLRWRTQNGAWQEQLIACTGTVSDFNARLPDELLKALNDTLRNTSSDIDLDFGPFGRFAASAVPRPSNSENRQGLAIPAALRARIEWLAQSCRSYQNTDHYCLRAMTDAMLLAHFGDLRVPSTLIGHLRSIQRDVETLRTDRSHG